MFYVNCNVEEDDGLDVYIYKIFELIMVCLDVVKNSLDFV